MEPESIIPPRSEATDYLYSLINKNVRITTTDSRMFRGSFKCTDSEANIALKHTYEYRHPPPPKPEDVAAGTTIKQDMTSRFLGLVVVPGQHIVKIEVEEFTSQMGGGGGGGNKNPTAAAATTTPHYGDVAMTNQMEGNVTDQTENIMAAIQR
ncbi:hypothetical protein QBC47DRAFT_382615 [Echria macrotheca]|uniref:Sm domain-containing protein n=1 Tax=Echria macrotheca TaxID=438768 RepID=A0AAJ0F967_9PEZI|nr:hypothetical protein QBC47DRAFT_382615 [Echria macrotheca]